MSQLEFRLPIVAVTQLNLQPRQGDFTQAFCQSTLPSTEQYVCSPPHNYPITPKKTYLLLKKTIYGLKQSPRHWYQKAKAAFLSLGLKTCANSPCLFTCTIIKNKPPLYLNLYVDDFIFFSESPEVEKVFEGKLSSLLKVEYSQSPQNF